MSILDGIFYLFLLAMAGVIVIAAGLGAIGAIATATAPRNVEKYYAAFRECAATDTHLTDTFCREYAAAMSVGK